MIAKDAMFSHKPCIFKELVQDETRGKLAAQAKARQEHDEKEALQDRLEEEEEARKHLEKQNQDLQAKVSVLCTIRVLS